MRFLKQKGFTLVELLIAIMILGGLIFVLIIAINPYEQLRKNSNAQKKSELNQIREALDSYYNDHNCYPTSIPWNQEWSEDGVVYMKRVPQDKLCITESSSYCYAYQPDTSSECPQWNVIYGKLEGTIRQLNARAPTCSYTNPDTGVTRTFTNYRCETCAVYAACGTMSAKYDYCLTSGNIDCTSILVIPTPYLGPTNTPAPTQPVTPTPTTAPTTPTPTIAPTRAPGQCLCTDARYDVRPIICNDVGVGNGLYCDSECTQPCY